MRYRDNRAPWLDLTWHAERVKVPLADLEATGSLFYDMVFGELDLCKGPDIFSSHVRCQRCSMLKRVTGSSISVSYIYYFHAKLLGNEPTTWCFAAATYQVCSLKLSLEFYSVSVSLLSPESKYTGLLCDGERETNICCYWAAFFWSIFWHLRKQPLTFVVLFGLTEHTVRCLCWGIWLGEMVPNSGHMVNAINQEGHMLRTALKGPVPLHVLDCQLLRDKIHNNWGLKKILSWKFHFLYLKKRLSRKKVAQMRPF